LTDIFRPEKRS